MTSRHENCQNKVSSDGYVRVNPSAFSMVVRVPSRWRFRHRYEPVVIVKT
jgi:hypothetical protein